MLFFGLLIFVQDNLDCFIKNIFETLKVNSIIICKSIYLTTFWFLAEHSMYFVNPFSLAYLWAVAAATGDLLFFFNLSNSASSSLKSLFGNI